MGAAGRQRDDHRGRRQGRAAAGQPCAPASRERRVVARAEALLLDARRLASPGEDARARALHRMLGDPLGPLFSAQLADRTCRSQSPERIASTVAHLIESLGTPHAFPPLERVGLRSAGLARDLAPRTLTRVVRQRLRAQTAHVLFDAQPGRLLPHIESRQATGSQVNINKLGEALVGEAEAERRVAGYVALAQQAGVDALSVKISSIASQISPLAFDDTLLTLHPRMARIYRAARGGPLVYLDMEAYRDLWLTIRTLEQGLAADDLRETRAGIVLQAYLPDSHGALQELAAFARHRHSRGGAPVHLRLVKGANMGAELVDASLRGWKAPTYDEKANVDGSFRRLLRSALRDAGKRGARTMHISVASHNVFEIAHALALAEEHGAQDAVHVELLEGMAEPLRRALVAQGVRTLVYTPTVEPEGFPSAVAYLVRRLDEGAADENYLRTSPTMRPGDADWERERGRYLEGCRRIATVDTAPRRSASPYAGRDRCAGSTPGGGAFRNEPDTDFASEENRDWIERALRRQRSLRPPTLRSVIGGQHEAGRIEDGHDPSRPGRVVYRSRLCTDAGLDHAVRLAQADADGWATAGVSRRSHVLMAAAEGLRRARGELIALCVADAAKRVEEADAEVSEAIDFAEYYRRSAAELERHTGAPLPARGVVLVAPPWNFPLAIPAGGVFAALMAGNRVLLKPAPETRWVAARFAQLCWDAGVPPTALHLLLTDERQAAALAGHPGVDVMILTGASGTARAVRRARPELSLLAETGGKNALIVTAMADRELAIADAVHGAFAHAGQKCSATSLLICEAEVYDDEHFMATLADATGSLHVGSAHELRSFVTPLIRPPEPQAPLARALAHLDAGERWLVRPRMDPANPGLVSPGVKLGVGEGSFMHRTELFGPVLGVMRARDLQHALRIANDTPYGLTAGLHSLDEREHVRFAKGMRAGNLYINRNTTGAIVGRQPFGGIKHSSFGPGAKAGGPNYLAGLVGIPEATRRGPKRGTRVGCMPAPLSRRFSGLLGRLDLGRLALREREYRLAFELHFARASDTSSDGGVIGEDNTFRHTPHPSLMVRIGRRATPLEIASVWIAAAICGSRPQWSVAPQWQRAFARHADGMFLRVENDDALVAREPTLSRIRVLGPPTQRLLRHAACADIHVAAAAVSDSGRLELLHYLQEQTLSVRYHRHGNLGARGLLKPVMPLARTTGSSAPINGH